MEYRFLRKNPGFHFHCYAGDEERRYDDDDDAATTAADKVPITGLQHHTPALDLWTRNVGHTEYPRA
ncbi:unnamed protein product [Gongylonema pulchrum]|uniref:Transposase n=1 Tax=Gongylonema pulchrum TaxID=637853 RepID=A0A183DTC1_9BILA|nr:unnamed protein product [Gongylonema pulchrum]